MNLIICCTPFQVLLAEKIIDSYPNEEFLGVMFVPIENEKYSYYSQKLKNKCKYFECVKDTGALGKVERLFFLFKLRFLAKKISREFKVVGVYLSNIHSAYLQTFISLFPYLKSIKTFDDGTINIDYNGRFYKADHGKAFLLSKLIGNKYSLNKIKESSECHFTIYKNRKNITENLIYVDLFELDFCPVNHQYVREVNILLGQPIFEITDGVSNTADVKNIAFTHQVIKEKKIDFYFPHPRERYFINGVEYIRTKLIFEDYFIENFKQDTKYTIYTFFSSVVLLLKELKLNNVEIISLKPSNMDQRLFDCYQIMIDNHIKCIEIEGG